MAEIGELTVAVKLSIDKNTAVTCLKIAEMYANQIGANVDVRRDDEGEIVLEYKGIGLPEEAK